MRRRTFIWVTFEDWGTTCHWNTRGVQVVVLDGVEKRIAGAGRETMGCTDDVAETVDEVLLGVVDEMLLGVIYEVLLGIIGEVLLGVIFAPEVISSLSGPSGPSGPFPPSLPLSANTNASSVKYQNVRSILCSVAVITGTHCGVRFITLMV